MLEIYDAISQMQRDLHLLGSEIQHQLHVILSCFEASREPMWYKPDVMKKACGNFGNTVSYCHSTNFDDSYIYENISPLLAQKIGKKSVNIPYNFVHFKCKNRTPNSSKLDICSYIFTTMSYLVISDVLRYFLRCTDEFRFVSNEIEF